MIINIMSSVINSEKFLLNNKFNNFSFINNVNIFDINKHNTSHQNKVNSINNNLNLNIVCFYKTGIGII